MSKSYEELRRGAVEAALGIEREDEVEFEEEPEAEFGPEAEAGLSPEGEGEAETAADAEPSPEGADAAAAAGAEVPADEEPEDAPVFSQQLLPDDTPEEYDSFLDGADVPDGVAFVPDGSGRPSVGAGARVIRPEFPERKSHGKVVFAVFAFIILAALLVLTGFLARERWYMHDDVADFPGTWAIRGEAVHGLDDVVTITITGDKIILDKDTTYRYTLDTRSKIITYTFQDLEGTGHYRFSADRNWIIIEDGHHNWLTTCAEDFWWQIRSWWATLTKTSQPPLGPTSGVTLLYRVQE